MAAAAIFPPRSFYTRIASAVVSGRDDNIDGYRVFRTFLEDNTTLDGYYYFKKYAASTIDSPDSRHGWKIHISIMKDHVEDAWDAICPILIRHGVYQAKVRVKLTEGIQVGKEIVIYAFKSPRLDWNKVLNEIEDALNSAHIPPSATIPHWRITIPANKSFFKSRSRREESIETDIRELAIRGSRFLYCEDDTPVESEEKGLAKIRAIIARADRGLFAGVIIEAAASATTAEAAGVAMTAITFITPGCKPPSGDDEDSSGLEGINYGGGGGSG